MCTSVRSDFVFRIRDSDSDSADLQSVHIKHIKIVSYRCGTDCKCALSLCTSVRSVTIEMKTKVRFWYWLKIEN